MPRPGEGLGHAQGPETPKKQQTKKVLAPLGLVTLICVKRSESERGCVNLEIWVRRDESGLIQARLGKSK